MSSLKIGIIGLGVGEQHIMAFDGHPACEVVALCDFSEEKLADISGKYPGKMTTCNADEIINDSSIGLISVASYDNFHFEQVKRCIEQEKHIFVEKPLCLHKGEALQLKKLLKEHPKVQLSCNLPLRTCPRFVGLKKAIASEEMGDVFYISADYLWGRVHKIIDGWRNEMEYYSIILGAGVHMIDVIMWLVGKRPVEVQGYGNGIAVKDTRLRYNDFAAIQLRFADGMIANVASSGGCVHPHFHKVEVYGSKKTFLQNINGTQWLDSSDPKAEMTAATDEYPAREKRSEIMTSFVRALLDKSARPIVSCDDTFSVMSVCFAAEQAVAEGRPVRIEYI